MRDHRERFVRIISQPRYPSPVSPAEAIKLLSRARDSGDHAFWPRDVSVLDAHASSSQRPPAWTTPGNLRLPACPGSVARRTLRHLRPLPVPRFSTQRHQRPLDGPVALPRSGAGSGRSPEPPDSSGCRRSKLPRSDERRVDPSDRRHLAHIVASRSLFSDRLRPARPVRSLMIAISEEVTALSAADSSQTTIMRDGRGGRLKPTAITAAAYAAGRWFRRRSGRSVSRPDHTAS